MITALICDFGGVLTTPLIAGFERYEERTGVTLEALGKALGAATEAYGDHPLFELERGDITEEEFGRRLGEHLDGSFDLTELRTSYFERLERNGPMIDLVGEIRAAGKRTALCTNNVREWEPLWKSKLPEIDDLFEVIVDSAFVGARKPERRIYEITMERLGGVPPEQCAFVDDLDVNCQAASELGMTAIRFEHSPEVLEEIRRTLA